MKTTLCIDTFRIETMIGCDPEEKIRPHEVLVSLRLTGNFSQAAVSDDLDDAVNYVAVLADIVAYTETAKNHLLEHLARDIIGICLEYSKVDEVRIKIDKAYLDLPCAHVGVEMEEKR